MTEKQQNILRGKTKASLVLWVTVLVFLLLIFFGVLVGIPFLKESMKASSFPDGKEISELEQSQFIEIVPEILAQYLAGNITMSVQVGTKPEEPRRTLVVKFIKQEFLTEDNQEHKQAVAYDIACLVLKIHPGINRYDQITIAYVKRVESGGIYLDRGEAFNHRVAYLKTHCQRDL